MPAAWDSAITYSYRGVIDHPDGTQSLYYFGQQGTHAHQDANTRGKFGIGRLSIIRDRWIALGADIPFASPGTNGSTTALRMRTVPLYLPQCPSTTHRLHMTLNAEVSVGGNLSIAIFAADRSESLPGFGHDDCSAIEGNRLAAPVNFQHDQNGTNMGPLAAQTLQLEFQLRPPARVFAWRFHCTAKTDDLEGVKAPQLGPSIGALMQIPEYMNDGGPQLGPSIPEYMNDGGTSQLSVVHRHFPKRAQMELHAGLALRL